MDLMDLMHMAHLVCRAEAPELAELPGVGSVSSGVSCSVARTELSLL
jgi:hypothetical protein